MKFGKGNKAAAGPRKPREGSPVTAAYCKAHYLELNQILPELEPADRAKVLAKLLEWEHAELYGKPKQDVELSGGVNISVTYGEKKS